MNDLYITISIVWCIFSCIGITETQLYRKYKRKIHDGEPMTGFQRSYVYKTHRKVDRIISIACSVCAIAWLITVFYLKK